MRRALLFAGIAAGAVLVFTTAAVGVAVPMNRNAKLSRHMDNVQDMAFCRVGYQIASSFPSYSSRTAKGPAKIHLINQSDHLNSQQEILGELLRGTFKVKAMELGMDEFAYDNVLAKFEAKAEVAAVLSFQAAEEPKEFLDKLDQVCAPFIS